ncbi:MAG: carboxypeptidase-like regulatory domain-containing protein [Planctomycetota bacterium]
MTTRQRPVTDAAGAPIAGAIVAAGVGPRHLDYEGERLIEHWTARTAETDQAGYFAIDGLPTGVLPVAIRGDGYGLWRTEVTIERHEATVIAARLELAATLVGTVTDGEGNPLPKASIRVYDREPRTPFVAGGQIDFDETFGYRAALAGNDGTYRVTGVTPGTAHAIAQQHSDRREREGVTVAYHQAALEIAPGDEARWDPVIDEGLSIEGRALYADGFPIPNLFINLADETEGGKKHVLISSREGVFRFLCLEDTTYEIRMQTPL